MPEYSASVKIKANFLKAQTTTTDRLAITHESQLCWYIFINGLFDNMQMNNTGVCNNTGNILKNYSTTLCWVFTRTESWQMLAVIFKKVSVERKKHEKIIADR